MIKKIKITNFKAIEMLEIEFNKNFNVIIGENNIGKTTIFEAIHLWKMCYDRCIKKDKVGFYRISNQAKIHIQFKNMESIRVYDDIELFNKISTSKPSLEIELIIEHDNIDYRLGFKVSKPGISNSYLQITYCDNQEFSKFEEMVRGVTGNNLSSFISVFESKPLTNIVAKEPYMYRSQIRDKISKGKSYEVLRNKILANKEKVSEDVSKVFNVEYKFEEKNSEDKTYISLKVNNNNILSFGSGFLQVTEIFSSIEFSHSKIQILLVDEPDAHLHSLVQQSLLNYLKMLDNIQVFVITHNEKLILDTEEENIIFLGKEEQEKRFATSLPKGTKPVVLANLVGKVTNLEKISISDKVIFVEGKSDSKFLNNLFCNNIQLSKIPVIELNGIDELYKKTKMFRQILENKKIIIIRDTDFTPLDQIGTYCERIKELTGFSKSLQQVVFQNGYGVESSLVAEKDKFILLLSYYYKLDKSCAPIIEKFILDMNKKYNSDVRSAEEHVQEILYKRFTEQKERRKKEEIYKDLTYAKYIKNINANNIQYIMTKDVLNSYLADIHKLIKEKYDIKKDKMNCTIIMEEYAKYLEVNYDEIVYGSHCTLIKMILNF